MKNGFEKEVLEDRLSDLINDSKESQNTIAKRIGVASATLTSYTSGEKCPGASILCKIADYFGVTTDYLLGRSPSKTYENALIGKDLGLTDRAIKALSKYDAFVPYFTRLLIVEIDIEEILSPEEIKEIAKDVVFEMVNKEFDGNLENILKDKITEVINDKITEVINGKNYL